MRRLTCQLSAYPDYLVYRMGLDFAGKYHTDAEYRNMQWKQILRWMDGKFGQWGCGMPDPPDSYSPVTLASVHLFSWLFGSQVVYSALQFPETPVYPLADMDDLFAFNPESAIVRERLEGLLGATRSLIDKHGPNAVTVPFHSAEMDGIYDLENTHCPLTIAYKLFGERILLEIYDNPEGVAHVFREIMNMTRDMGERFRMIAGLEKPRHVLMSACSACFVSPEHWERMVMPLVEEYCGERPVFFHSCGSVNSHLPAFGRLGEKLPFLKFDCRESAGIDIQAAARAMPGVEISYMMSPALCLTRTPEDMAMAVRKAVNDAGDSPMNLILMLPHDTPDAIVDAFFQTCVEMGAEPRKNAGFRFV